MALSSTMPQKVNKKFQFVVSENFPFGPVAVLSSGKELILYHTIPTFNDPKKRSLLKYLSEKQSGKQHFLLFSLGFHVLSSACALNFEQS